MFVTDAAYLDVLAACLGAGMPLSDALSRIESAGPSAVWWASRVRAFLRPGTSVEDALLASRLIDATERALLAAAVTPDAVEGLLRALAVRRRRRRALYVTTLRGLLGPFAIAALTIVLDPLPNLIGNGSYLWPVFRGLVVLLLVTAFLALGVPAILRSPSLGPRALAACARLPGLSWFAARYAEGELVTVSAPLVSQSQVASDKLSAVSTLIAWSPLGEEIRAATSTGAPGWGLERLAPHLSLATNLSIVGGVASNHLAGRLAARGEEIAAELTTYARIGVKVAGYALVVVLTIQSLVGLVSRGIPGVQLPGAAPSNEQKELDEVMKAL